jgi:hypothetical protein
MKPKTDEEFAAWVAKQPVWVSRKIGALRSQIAALEDTLTERSADHSADSNVLVNPYYRDKEEQGWWLPKDSHIRYYLGEDRSDWHARMDVRIRRESRSEGSYLEINAGNGMRIEPRASNVVWLWPNDD